MPIKHMYLWLTVLLPVALCAQQPVQPVNNAHIDSFATTIRYRGDLPRLTYELTSPFPDKLSKTRAIFKWIADNISYDYKFYNKYVYKGKEPKTYTCSNNSDCAAKKMLWEMQVINNTLKRKKAVCQGYAMLLKKMCEQAGIKAEIVPGYVRTTHYQVGGAGTLDHAWNAVMTDDSTYQLLDVTWAAGGCAKNDDGKLLFYQKQFNNYYWLTPAADFARNHFPKKSEWVLIPGYTKEKFMANPYYASRILKDIKLMEPATGIIPAKKGDTLHFKFEYAAQPGRIQVNSNHFRNPDIWIVEETGRNKKIRRLDTIALKRQQYINYTQDGNYFTFDYPVTDNSLYVLDILFDRERVMRFNVTNRK